MTARPNDAGVYRSDDRGASWTSIAGDLPERHLVWRVVQDHVKPDLVVLDVMLPDGSGLEAFQRIQEIDPRTPVIFITAGEGGGTGTGAAGRC